MLSEYGLEYLARERVSQLHRAAAHALVVSEARPPLRTRLATWLIRTGRRLLADDHAARPLAPTPSRSCPS